MPLTTPTLPTQTAPSNPNNTFGPQLPTYTNPANQTPLNSNPLGTSATFNTSGGITAQGTGLVGALQRGSTNTAYTVPERDQQLRSAELLLAMQNLNAAGRQNSQNLMNQIQGLYDTQIPDLLNRNAATGNSILSGYSANMAGLGTDITNQGSDLTGAIGSRGTGTNTAINNLYVDPTTGLIKQVGDLGNAQTTAQQNLATGTGPGQVSYQTQYNALMDPSTGLQSLLNSAYNTAGSKTGQFGTDISGINTAYGDNTAYVQGAAGQNGQPGTGYTGLQELQDTNTGTLGGGLTKGLTSYLDSLGGLEGLVDTYGRTATQDLTRSRDAQYAGNQSSLASRGLGNTTVLDSMNRGTSNDFERNLQSLQESINNQKLAANQQLAASKYNAVQQNAQMQNQLAQQGIGQRQATIDATNAARQQQLAAQMQGAGILNQNQQAALANQSQGVDRALGVQNNQLAQLQNAANTGNQWAQNLANLWQANTQAQQQNLTDTQNQQNNVGLQAMQNWMTAMGQAPNTLAQLGTQQQQQDTALARDLSNQRLQFMQGPLGAINQYPSQTDLYNLALQSMSAAPYPVASSGGVGASLLGA